MPTIDQIARAIYLAAFDNTASAIKAWDGDGTKDNPGHAKRKDRAYRAYCRMAGAAMSEIASVISDDFSDCSPPFIAERLRELSFQPQQ